MVSSNFSVRVVGKTLSYFGSFFRVPFRRNSEVITLPFKASIRSYRATFKLSVARSASCSDMTVELYVEIYSNNCSYIRPKSIPVVRPFRIPLPPGVIQPIDTYTFTQRLSEGHTIMLLPFYLHEQGDWFISFYLIGTAKSVSECE